MPRASNLLTIMKVNSLKKPGKYGDGNGLFLRIDQRGAKRWVFRYTAPDGRRRDRGLGNANSISLTRARDLADKAREALEQGIDPMHQKPALATQPEVECMQVPTFGEFADRFVELIAPEFRNPKHLAQWKMTIGDRYCFSLRRKAIDAVSAKDVLEVLRPVWVTKPETASRLRGRIERVLDGAKAEGLRSGDNPAVWRGGLKAALPKRKKLIRGHHRALPFEDLPLFMASLLERRASAARALAFLILTAARSGEVRGATKSEFDLDAAVWTIPAERMKAGKEHRVPLTPMAVQVIREQLERGDGSELVFPGQKVGKPMSDMTLAKLVKRIGHDVTVHGFRSTFRDWVGEETEFPRELAEAALAHTVGDATERAYRRSDALARRRVLMQAWNEICFSGVGSSRS